MPISTSMDILKKKVKMWLYIIPRYYLQQQREKAYFFFFLRDNFVYRIEKSCVT